jgi:hypothetical protein
MQNKHVIIIVELGRENIPQTNICFGSLENGEIISDFARQ